MNESPVNLNSQSSSEDWVIIEKMSEQEYKAFIEGIKSKMNEIISSIQINDELKKLYSEEKELVNKLVGVKEKIKTLNERERELYNVLENEPPACSVCGEKMIKVSVREYDWYSEKYETYTRWECPNAGKLGHLRYKEIDNEARIQAKKEIERIRSEQFKLYDERDELEEKEKKVREMLKERYEEWIQELSIEQKIAVEIVIRKPCNCDECNGVKKSHGMRYLGGIKSDMLSVLKILLK